MAHIPFTFNPHVSLHLRLVDTSLLPYPFVMLIVIFMFIIYILTILINYRQHSRYSKVNQTTDILSMLTSLNSDSPLRESNYFRKQSLGKNKTGFLIITGTYIFIKNVIYLVTPYFSFIWELSEKSMELNSSNHQIITSIVFLCIHFTVDFILTFPLELCSIFIDRLHNNNKSEYMKNILFVVLSMPVNILFGLFLCYLVSEIKSSAVFLIIPSVILVLRVLIYLIPYTIKKKELKENDELFKKLQTICRIFNFPYNKFYITTTTTKSMKGNKYNLISSLFNKLKQILSFHCSCSNNITHYGNLITKKKNIIISKSFINDIADLHEIDGLFAHEYYHYFYNSNIVMFLVYTLSDCIYMYLLYTFMTNYSIFRSFGYTDTPSAIGYSIFITCLSNSILFIINFIKHSIIYTYEYSADKYTVSMSFGKELRDVLIHSFNQYKDDFNPDILYSLCYYENPPIIYRLKKIDDYLSNATNIYNDVSLDNI